MDPRRVRAENVESAVSFYSGKTGDISRQLGLAAIAVLWLLPPEHGINPDYLPALKLILCSLLVDVFHYLVGTCRFGWEYMVPDRALNELARYRFTNGVLFFLTGGKLVLMFFAYAMLLCAITQSGTLW